MKILAFDTATAACSASLMVDDKVSTQFEFAPRQHHRLLLTMIDTLLAQSKLRLVDLDALAISHGPGSFTGLRIAASVAQGLALGTNLPVLTVSSLQAAAQFAHQQWGYDRVFVLEDAQRSQLYAGAYQQDADGMMSEIMADSLIDVDKFSVSHNLDWFSVGSAWNCHRQALQLAFADQLLAVKADCYPHAEAVVRLACQKFGRGQFDVSAPILPSYLRSERSWKTLVPRVK